MQPDRHVLYEAAVQGVSSDLDFLERVYRRHHGRTFRDLREDFCGTGQLAAAWVLRRPENRAWAVDLDAGTLKWALAHRLPRMGGAALRLTLIHDDVRHVRRPAVDAVLALNFSYWVFKQRSELVRYFESARRSLRPGGLLMVSAFGGSGAQQKLVERSRIRTSMSMDGDIVPAFTYVWEQRSFNPIDGDLQCSIHFELRDGTRLWNAFRYDWRMWTLPEIRDAMAEAGFRASEVYVETWDYKHNRSSGVYRLRRRFETQAGWLAHVIGIA